VRRLDKDGDGRVSREEFDGPARAFDRHDANGDGYIDATEAPNRGSRRTSRAATTATLEVMTVGTGSPQYNAERSRPSMLVTHGDTRILVDMGEGTEARLQQAKIDLGSIDAYCFTHHHRDHNAEAMTLLPQAWQRGFAGPVVGPEGTRDLVTFLRSFYAKDLAYRRGKRGGEAAPLPEAIVHELPSKKALTVGGVKITTVEVPHSIATFAYRFEAGGRSIVISGDLTYTKDLGPFAKDADVLVMDSGAIVYVGQRARPQGARKRKKPAAHATCEEVARMAAEAKAKKLVLVHFRTGAVDEEATRKRMGEIYDGEIVFAKDLDIHR